MDIESVVVERDATIVFMGTPEFAVPVLQGLIDNYKVKAVITQPDKKVGREGEVKYSPVKQLAMDNNILVIQPESLKDEWYQITELHPDIIITCAYGQILPRELLVYPKYGCINVHASLLPKLRGGAPIHRAILEGYKETGVTIMYMAPGLDDGDIITQKKVEIKDTDTTEILHDELSVMGRDLLLETLPLIFDNKAPRIKQDESLSTFAYTIKKEDEKIDFADTKRQIYNQIRGLNSWPGAYFILEGKRIKVWEAIMTDNNYSNLVDGQISKLYKEGIGVKVSNGEIVLTVIQPEGKNKMNAIDFINGQQDRDSLVGKFCE